MDTSKPATEIPRLLELPEGESLTVSARLWLGIGVAAYNHALLVQKPIRIVGAEEAASQIAQAQFAARLARQMREGNACVLDARQLGHAGRAALASITAALVDPLGMTLWGVGDGYIVIGSEQQVAMVPKQPRDQAPHSLGERKVTA